MRAHALHGIGDALDLGDDGVVVVGVKPADVAHLSAGIGVEGGVVEHDVAALAGLQLLHADAGAVLRFDDGQHFAAGGERLAIAFEDRRRQRLIRRAGGFLRAAFPGSPSARLRCSSIAASKTGVETDASDHAPRLHEVDEVGHNVSIGERPFRRRRWNFLATGQHVEDPRKY